MTEDEMLGWHHQLNRHEFEQTPGYSKGQVLTLAAKGSASVPGDFISVLGYISLMCSMGRGKYKQDRRNLRHKHSSGLPDGPQAVVQVVLLPTPPATRGVSVSIKYC